MTFRGVLGRHCSAVTLYANSFAVVGVSERVGDGDVQ